MADVLKITPTESVEVRSSTPEALEIEATYKPGGSRRVGRNGMPGPLAFGAMGRRRGYSATP